MNNKFILLSLDDENSKHLAEVLTNKTCKKILDLLSEKDLTTTEIADELKIPINTADYNVKKLVKSKLIEQKSHFWSVKGKKMPVYTLSNKKIIISPKKSLFVNKILPAFLITGISALLVKSFTTVKQIPILLSKDFESVASTSGALASTPNTIQSIALFSPWQWFLLGAWFAIVIFILLNLKHERR